MNNVHFLIKCCPSSPGPFSHRAKGREYQIARLITLIELMNAVSFLPPIPFYAQMMQIVHDGAQI